MASATGPRYAPEDPTLPKPWRGLIDGKTGYLYFWNPQTNVTQYQRPTSSVEPEKALPVPPLSSSVEVRPRGNSPVNDNGEHGRGGEDEPKFKVETVSHQSVKAATDHSQSVVNKTVSDGDGRSARESGSLGAGSGLSADAYRRKHEITVTGNEVPPPFTSFQETGFPSEILREVRYLLPDGVNVVRCAAQSEA